MRDILDSVESAWPLISQEPWLFVFLSASIFLIGWIAARAFYSQKMESLYERINILNEHIKLAGIVHANNSKEEEDVITPKRHFLLGQLIEEYVSNSFRSID